MRKSYLFILTVYFLFSFCNHDVFGEIVQDEGSKIVDASRNVDQELKLEGHSKSQEEELRSYLGYVTEESLELAIEADQDSYFVGQEVWINFIFKNVSQLPLELEITRAPHPIHHTFHFFELNGKDLASSDSPADNENRTTDRITIEPGGEYVSPVPLHKWKLAGLYRGYNHIGSEARQFRIRGIYFTPVGVKRANTEILFLGDLESQNDLIIKIVEDNSAFIQKVPNEEAEWFKSIERVPGFIPEDQLEK